MPRVFWGNQNLLNGTPAWRIVVFPNSAVFTYDDLEHATNARIIARAWFNARKHDNNVTTTWNSFARYLNYFHPRKLGKRQLSISDALSSKLYGNICRGTLPKDERARNLLIQLAEYPWKD